MWFGKVHGRGLVTKHSRVVLVQNISLFAVMNWSHLGLQLQFVRIVSLTGKKKKITQSSKRINFYWNEVTSPYKGKTRHKSLNQISFHFLKHYSMVLLWPTRLILLMRKGGRRNSYSESMQFCSAVWITHCTGVGHCINNPKTEKLQARAHAREITFTWPRML